MTWCGHQGFQAPPNNTFLVDGKNMGNWAYEVRLSLSYLSISLQPRSSDDRIPMQCSLRIPTQNLHQFHQIHQLHQFFSSQLQQVSSAFHSYSHILILPPPPAWSLIPPHPLCRAHRALRSTSSRLRIRQGLCRWGCRISIACFKHLCMLRGLDTMHQRKEGHAWQMMRL